MPHINLLPHREQERQARQQRFNRILAGVFLISILLVVLIYIQVSGLVSDQTARNRYLTSQIQRITAQIGQVNHLRAVRTHLLDRIKIIERLQSQRSVPAHLFDQLIRTIPSGVYLISLSQQPNGIITLRGVAQSPAKVSSYMRHIADSPWLADPQLSIVRTHSVGPLRRSDFTVQTHLIDKRARQKHLPHRTSRGGRP
ncbi:MAG: PilN domain-containing protein [Gammaproteobacteria bacterium]